MSFSFSVSDSFSFSSELWISEVSIGVSSLFSSAEIQSEIKISNIYLKLYFTTIKVIIKVKHVAQNFSTSYQCETGFQGSQKVPSTVKVKRDYSFTFINVKKNLKFTKLFKTVLSWHFLVYFNLHLSIWSVCLSWLFVSSLFDEISSTFWFVAALVDDWRDLRSSSSSEKVKVIVL